MSTPVERATRLYERCWRVNIGVVVANIVFCVTVGLLGWPTWTALVSNALAWVSFGVWRWTARRMFRAMDEESDRIFRDLEGRLRRIIGAREDS